MTSLLPGQISDGDGSWSAGAMLQPWRGEATIRRPSRDQLPQSWRQAPQGRWGSPSNKGNVNGGRVGSMAASGKAGAWLQHSKASAWILAWMLLLGTGGLSRATATTPSLAFLDDGIRAALVGRIVDAGETADRLRDLDERLREEGAPPTGLADNMLALAAAVAPDGDTRRQWQREALRWDADPELRDMLKRDLRADPIAQFRRLGREDAWIRAVEPVNSILRNTFAVFEGRPQAVLQIPIDLVFAIPNALRLSERDRKRALLAERIERDPSLRSRAPNWLSRKASEIRRKMKREAIGQDLRLARSLYDLGRLRETVALCSDILEAIGEVFEAQAGGARHALVVSRSDLARAATRRWRGPSTGASRDRRVSHGASQSSLSRPALRIVASSCSMSLRT